MSTLLFTRRASGVAALLIAAVLTLSACATAPAAHNPPPVGGGLGSAFPPPPNGEVIAQGTVLDTDGDVRLCLGPVAESYPPQCRGITLLGWSWDGLEGSESTGDVTWGAYAVTGTYDGESVTVTAPPIMLALYDPIAPPDPTGGVPGTTDESRLLEIQDELPRALGTTYLSSAPADGYLWVQAVWDDGTLQASADDEYGSGVVLIQSAMAEIAAP